MVMTPQAREHVWFLNHKLIQSMIPEDRKILTKKQYFEENNMLELWLKMLIFYLKAIQLFPKSESNV